MFLRFVLSIVLSCSIAVGEKAQEHGQTPGENGAAISKKKPTVDDAIPDPIKTLPAPIAVVFPSGIQMAVTANTESAQTSVNQGLNHLHGGWEFEASRHFAAAMREDPECLLAHWGMVMSLLTPSGENDFARGAATERFLDLVDQGKGTDLERGYAYGLIKYLEGGPAAAATAFRKVAMDFPNDIQAGIFSALFNRSGFDSFGSPTSSQISSEKYLMEMFEKNPQNPLPLNALLSIRSDGGDLSESLPLARKLCQMIPNYAPYFHMLGHYEWRCGEHSRAASAFGRASSHLEKWMKSSKITVADCPEWIKAECYRIVALVSKGDFDTAYAASRQIAATPLPIDRNGSAGVRLLLWDAKTMPARVLLHRGLDGNANEALNSLPTPLELKNTHSQSLAFWWIDGLRFALEARRLIDERKLAEARDVITALTHHGEMMGKNQINSMAGGERSSWNRSFRALEVLASELRGRLVMATPEKGIGTAYNWFASAAERQRHAIMMHPPMLMTPMQIHVGEYYLAAQRPSDAIEAYQIALENFPNDMTSLLGLQISYEKAGLPEKAVETSSRLEALKSH